MSNTAAKLPPMMTVADFLDWPGDGVGTRYELIDGELRAMAPASDAHNRILANLTILVGGHLRTHRPGCSTVATPGVQPRTSANWNFRIPDLGVTCSPNRPGDVMVPDPILLVEVLSPNNMHSTQEAVRAYTTLPSVMEILVLHSTSIKAEILVKAADGSWPLDPEVVEAGGLLKLASIEASWPVAEFYRGTHLVT